MSSKAKPSPDYASSPPSAEAVKKASNQAVFSEKSEQTGFGDLIKPSQPGGKVIAIFIRHFYCGLCQEYVSHMSKLVTPEQLAAKGASLFFVGCGDSALIANYRKLTKCPFPIYSEPNRDIYTTLGLTMRTLDRGADSEAPSHSKQGLVGGLFKSLAGAVKMGSILSRSGDVQQLGGDFVFGDDGQVIYSHRMVNTRDHTEAHELLKHAGVDVDAPVRPKPSKKASSQSAAAAPPAAAPAAAPVAAAVAAPTSTSPSASAPSAQPAPAPAAATNTVPVTSAGTTTNATAPAPTTTAAPASAPSTQTAAATQTALESTAVISPATEAVKPTPTIAQPTPTSASISEPSEPTAAAPQTSEPKPTPVVALPKPSEGETAAAAPAPAAAP